MVVVAISITRNYQHLAFDRSNRFFRELSARINQDPAAIIPFVGAGLSHYGVGDAKLPLWRQLVDRMRAYATDLGVLDESASKRAQSLIDEGLFIAATDLIVDAIGPKLFRSFVREELDVKKRTLSPAALSLVVIAWSIIVTTNLDETLEEAHRLKHNRPPLVITQRQISELIEAINSPRAGDVTTLAKIHGTLDDFASWCLTEKHYQRLIDSPAYREILRSLFLKRLFFVGFGLSDKDFDLMQEYLERIFPDGDVDSYALVPHSRRGSERLTYLIQKRGLKPIYYNVSNTIDESDPWGGHSEMYECLKALTSAWLSSNSSIRVHMQNFAELEPAFIGRTDEMIHLDDIVFRRNRSVQVIGFGGEGKTSLVQEWVNTRAHELRRAGFVQVFGFSFYSGSPDRFINDCFLALGSQKTSWDVARRLRFICDEASRHRILFVLDGVEVLQDPDGDLSNPYLQEFIDSIERTDSRIVFTSRIEVPGPFVVLPLRALDVSEIDELVKMWQHGDLHPAALEAIKRRAGGHALSIRLSLGMNDNSTTEEDGPPWEMSVDSCALTANKLERTLKYYETIITASERAFLICFSVFRRPTRFDLVEKIFRNVIPNFEINAPLRSTDLRSVVKSLLRKRLLIASTGTQITAHPNVRDYFRNLASDLVPLHASITRTLMAGVSDLEVESLSDAERLIDICHHAAGAGLWSEFHYIFKKRLMKEYRDYLCDSLGAWTEALQTVMEAFPNRDLAATPIIAPEYYSSHYARCLKHLGFAKEAIEAYPRALLLCAATEHTDSALYTNNFLTLQVYAGNIQTASRMALWNIALLGWIEQDWARRWQIEHGGYSMAWLALILGDLPTAAKLFDLGGSAWAGAEADRVEIFDHYPLYSTELFLSQTTADVVKAETVISKYMEAGLRNNWPETITRAHIARSLLERHKARHATGAERIAHLNSARQACAMAADTAKSIFAPPVTVELQIEQLRVGLVFDDRASDRQVTEEILANLGKTIERLGWKLYEPEYLALRGLHAAKEGNTQRALAFLADAETRARAMKNRLALCSQSQSIAALRALLGVGGGLIFDESAESHSDMALIDYQRPTGIDFETAIVSQFRVAPVSRQHSSATDVDQDH